MKFLMIALCTVIAQAGTITLTGSLSFTNSLPGLTLNSFQQENCASIYSPSIQNCSTSGGVLASVPGISASTSYSATVTADAHSGAFLSTVADQQTGAQLLTFHGGPATQSSTNASAVMQFAPSLFSLFPSVQLSATGVRTVPTQNSGVVVDEGLNLATPTQVAARNIFLEFISVFYDGQYTFSVDPVDSTMSLIADPSTSGEILVELTDSPSISSLLDYEFTNGIVQTSIDNLGLNLPGVGSNASFQTAFHGVSASVPSFAVAPSDTLTLYSGGALDQNLGPFSPLTIPEPMPLAMCAVGATFFLWIRRRRVFSRITWCIPLPIGRARRGSRQ
jgi:hypothetical protein